MKESQLPARAAESLDGFWRLQAGVALGWVPGDSSWESSARGWHRHQAPMGALLPWHCSVMPSEDGPAPHGGDSPLPHSHPGPAPERRFGKLLLWWRLGAECIPKQIAAVVERAESGALRLPQHIASVGASILQGPRSGDGCPGTKPSAAAINAPGCCTSRMCGDTQRSGCEVGLGHGAGVGTEPLAQAGLCVGMRMLCPQLCMCFWLL